jgi:outer membrane protein OmpA-like peptidoglycan-associated protein
VKRTHTSLVLLTTVAALSSGFPHSSVARGLIPDQPSVEIRLEALRALRQTTTIPAGNPFTSAPSAPLANAPSPVNIPAYAPKPPIAVPAPPPPVVAVAPPPPPKPVYTPPPVVIATPKPPAPVETRPAPPVQTTPAKKTEVAPLKQIAQPKAAPSKSPIVEKPAPATKSLEKEAVSLPLATPKLAMPSFEEKYQPVEPSANASKNKSVDSQVSPDVKKPLPAPLPSVAQKPAEEKKPLPAPQPKVAPNTSLPPLDIVEETAPPPALELSLDELMKEDKLKEPAPSLPSPASKATASIKESKEPTLKKESTSPDVPSTAKAVPSELPEPDLDDLTFESFDPKKELPSEKSKVDAVAEKTNALPLPPLPKADNSKNLPLVQPKEMPEDKAVLPLLKDEEEDIPEELKQLGSDLPASVAPSQPKVNDKEALPPLLPLPATKTAESNAEKDLLPLPPTKAVSTDKAADKSKEGAEANAAMTLPKLSSEKMIAEKQKEATEDALAKGTLPDVSPPEMDDAQMKAKDEVSFTPPPPVPAEKESGFLPNLKASFTSFIGGKEEKPIVNPPAITPADEKNDKESGLPALPTFDGVDNTNVAADSGLPPLPSFGGKAPNPDDKIAVNEPLPPLPFGEKADERAEVKGSTPSDAPELPSVMDNKAATQKDMTVASLEKPSDALLPPLKEPSLGKSQDGAALSVFFSQSETEVPLAFQQPLITLSKQLVANDSKIKVVAYASGTEDQKSIARRVSLARALAVRAFLIDLGVDNVRISVQALGNDVKKGPSERADVIIAPKG